LGSLRMYFGKKRLRSKRLEKADLSTNLIKRKVGTEARKRSFH